MISRVQTPTNNLENSLNFYKKIGFTSLNEQPNLVSDGKVIVEINTDRFARAGVKLFQNSWAKEIAILEKTTNIISVDGGFIVGSPSGCWVYLMEDQAADISLENIPPPVVGQLAGISLETISMEASIVFWNTLGFSKMMGGLEQGWTAMANAEGFAVSAMKAHACPHLFFTPSFTYFNGQENLAIIDKIKALDIPITEEITHFNSEGIVDNIIIRDPGGFGFFLFSD